MSNGRRSASRRTSTPDDSQTPSKRRLDSEDPETSGTNNGANDSMDSGSKRRRASSRVKVIPNYSQGSQKSSTRHKSPSNGESPANKVPSCYRAKQNQSESKVQDRESQMADLIMENDLLVEELYHLKEFTSLVYFKPGEPAQSSKYDQFHEQYQLWPKIDDQKLGRRSRRITEHNDPLKQKIDKIIEAKKQVLRKLKEAKEKTMNGNGLTVEDNEPQKELVGADSRKSSNFKRSKIPKTKAIVKKEEDLELGDLDESDHSQNTQNASDSETYSDISIPPLSPSSHIPKVLRLKFEIKPQLVTHPSHVTKPLYHNLGEFFTSYRATIEEPGRDLPIEEYEEYLSSQSSLISKIRDGLDRKLLRLDTEENIFRNVPTGFKEPTMIKKNANYHQSHYKLSPNPFRMRNELTHYDHLLAQGVRSAKLIHDSRNVKVQKCRKIAAMIDAHFKKLSQEEERKQREFERKIVRLAKDTAKEVKKKWLVAVKAYKILEEREKERERMVKSKEQLSKILDHSTKVLGAQISRKSVSQESTEGLTPEPEPKSEGEDEDEDDENMSSSSSEGADHDGDNIEDEVKDDSSLSLEELKEKYKDLDKLSVEPDSDDESEDEEGPTTLAALYGGESNGNGKSLSVVDQLTDEERKALLESESGDPLLDEDSDEESSDDSLSDSESESESDEDVSEDEVEESKPGLSSLFGKTEEDESIYSEKSDDDVTPPSSAKEEEEEHNGNAQGEDSHITSIPDVPTPILLRGTLREYQKQGLNWLASLYNNGTNGILADEMGLGKTIQTISLISYLACEKNIWGPHLIVVPTSVMLNWEMEFKRFAPGFKVLTYYGSPQQRKEKRKGWNTPDTFHVCITSYQLVVQDQQVFRRKKWRYMILDEAHNIKNFRSQRWRSLLNFNTENRLLLTGTPLQNNIMELWSLLYFLMPSSKTDQMMPDGFANLMDFQQWFGRPVDKIIQGGGYSKEDSETMETVNKLHQVLRPYLLRRLKQDVEKQMPAKHEHIIYCRLSKRQRLLYDDFMSRAQTKETLASGNFLSIINCLMQLRKVCNHPDLFEVRPILTSFAMNKSVASKFAINDMIVRKLSNKVIDDSKVNLQFLNMLPVNNTEWTSFNVESMRKISASGLFVEQCNKLQDGLKEVEPDFNSLPKYYEYLNYKERATSLESLRQRLYVNEFTCDKPQVMSSNLIRLLSVDMFSKQNIDQLTELDLLKPVETRALKMFDAVEKFAFVTPKVVAEDMVDLTLPSELQYGLRSSSNLTNPFHHSQVKLSITFPDKSLLQYDCGKLQKLASLLLDLIPKGHRVLIFTQMTKVLDILEKFMNYNGYKYMRLDGATKIEDRQLLTERFNKDSKIKAFILSTRSGGLGINLTGADTVIFYDSDWNPAMDKQCQDRCHRIGQTRDVHIYRFVSEYTIESNILKKANQKRQLDNVVIQEGDFTTDYFSKITVKDLLGEDTEADVPGAEDRLLLDNTSNSGGNLAKVLEQAEDAEDAVAAEVAMKEANLDNDDFMDDQNAKNRTKSPSVDGVSNASVDPEDLVKRIESKEVTTVKVNGKDTNGQAVDEMDVDEGDIEQDEEEEEDDVGHIDEYMIRFIAGGFYFD